MAAKRNRRGFVEATYEGQHLTVEELRTKNTSNDYLHLTMPDYPKPEFHLFYVKHDTNQGGLQGIFADRGFRSPRDFLWWNLVAMPGDIQSAENRMLEEAYPDRTEEQRQMQPSFLSKFATSPAFAETSRLGSFRFTFRIREVLDAYREQFCSGQPPVMRVYGTILYKKEIMYTVLVHSPADNGKFSDYPLLADDTSCVCRYNQEMGSMTWKVEAMCNSHSFQLMRNDSEKQMTAEDWNQFPRYFVWDNVSLAFHLDNQVLTFDRDRLRDSLTICSPDARTYGNEFHDPATALDIVQGLWPEYQGKPEHCTEESGEANTEAGEAEEKGE